MSNNESHSNNVLPENIARLHIGEEKLRQEAIKIISEDEALKLHIGATERTMDLCDLLRQFGSDVEDDKVIRILGIRCFNSFASALKLALAGYSQTSAMILRDVLETVFLLDLFQSERSLIVEWRLADEKVLKNKFGPVSVRKALDARDGNVGKKREALYKLFCELATHPNMKSDWMLRPQKDGDAFIGPFIEKPTLSAVLTEMGKLAIQVGEILSHFFDPQNNNTKHATLQFTHFKAEWFRFFYSP